MILTGLPSEVSTTPALGWDDFWQGLSAAYCPFLGVQGPTTLRDYAAGRKNLTTDAGESDSSVTPAGLALRTIGSGYSFGSLTGHGITKTWTYLTVLYNNTLSEFSGEWPLFRENHFLSEPTNVNFELGVDDGTNKLYIEIYATSSPLLLTASTTLPYKQPFAAGFRVSEAASTVHIFLDGKIDASATSETPLNSLSALGLTLHKMNAAGETKSYHVLASYLWNTAKTDAFIERISKDWAGPFRVKKRLAKAAASGTTFTKTYTESQGHSDTFARISIANRIYNDNQGHADTYARTATANRAQQDNIGTTDAYTRLANAQRVVLEGQGIRNADNYQRIADANRSYADNQGHTDVYVRIASALRSLIDTEGNTDTYARTASGNRSFSDNQGHSDAYARQADAFRHLIDTLGIADAATLVLVAAGAHAISVSELLGTRDTFSRLSNTLRSITDTLGILDTYARQSTASRVHTEQLGTDDEFARVASALRSLSDNLAMIDDPNAVLNPFVVVLSAIFLVGLAQRNILGKGDTQRNVAMTGKARVGS